MTIPTTGFDEELIKARVRQAMEKLNISYTRFGEMLEPNKGTRGTHRGQSFFEKDMLLKDVPRIAEILQAPITDVLFPGMHLVVNSGPNAYSVSSSGSGALFTQNAAPSPQPVSVDQLMALPPADQKRLAEFLLSGASSN